MKRLTSFFAAALLALSLAGSVLAQETCPVIRIRPRRAPVGHRVINRAWRPPRHAGVASVARLLVARGRGRLFALAHSPPCYHQHAAPFVPNFR
jgi:hypothetical protein